MQRSYGIGFWAASMLAGLSLVGTAVVLADRQPAPLAVPTVQAVVDPAALSHSFREVAKAVLPSVVVIETTSKPAQSTQGLGSPLGDENSPMFRFFGDDPRFKDFFKQMPERKHPFQQQGRGSGFVIDASGVILTNSHVVKDAESVKVRLHDGRVFVAHDIHTDPRTDVAVVKIDGADGLQPLALGDSDAMEIGDWVLAVGSPFGLDLSVTHGIISAKSRGPGINEREDYLQTDAPINPGNSGGPLLNLRGQVIGINTAISSRGGGSDGVGFAIPIDMAKWVATQLRDHGTVQRAYLGVGIQPVDDELAGKFHSPVGQGALINKVLADSPAADAKLQVGDIVLEVGGRKVHGPRDLQGAIEQTTIGRPVEMRVLRDGHEMTVSVTVREMPGDFIAAAETNDSPGGSEVEKSEFKELGLEIGELTPVVARQLELKTSAGVVITSVDENGPAFAAGLRTGMVIEQVARAAVNSPEEFQEAVKSTSLKDGVLLLVRSGEGTRFVVLGGE